MNLYLINYKEIYEQLYRLEMRHLLGFEPKDKYFITTKDIDVNASTFFKGVLSLEFSASSLEELTEQVKSASISYESYKIEFIKLDQDVNYETRLKAMHDIGYAIDGEFLKSGAKTTLRVTKLDGVWYFGMYQRNSAEWQNRISKPHHYSIALETRLARTLVSIASTYGSRLVDPCCGIGTVVIEAKQMGYNIEGYDINRKVVWYSRQNLEHYKLKADTQVSDIANINQVYDVAIVDLPYGKFVKQDKEMQSTIFEHAKKVASVVIFVAMEDKQNEFNHFGYQVLDYCVVPKVNQFKRYIYVTRGV